MKLRIEQNSLNPSDKLYIRFLAQSLLNNNSPFATREFAQIPLFPSAFLTFIWMSKSIINQHEENSHPKG